MRAFVCNILPENLITKVGAPQAPNNFCTNLIEGGCFHKVCSIVPMAYYHEQIKSSSSISYYQGKRNFSRIKKMFSLLISNMHCAWDLRGADSVWFYNICETHFISYILLRYVLVKKVFVILLDYTPSASWKSISHYFPFLCRHSYGMISLSMRTDIIHSNMVFKSGIIPSEKIKEKIEKTNENLVFLFSGAIMDHAGFPLAFNVFKKMSNVELYISGHGNLSKYNFDEYPNIHYLGYMEYEEYLKLYDKVDVCLSLRNPDFPENKNNFPSKILEYFSYNKIVISTIDYPELKDFRFVKSEYDEYSLSKIIQELNSKTNKELCELMDNRDALKKHFSIQSWIESFEEIEKCK